MVELGLARVAQELPLIGVGVGVRLSSRWRWVGALRRPRELEIGLRMAGGMRFMVCCKRSIRVPFGRPGVIR